MTECELAQDAILQSDDPARFAAEGSALAQHVAGCAACQEIVTRVVRIEAEARGLAMPGEARGFESASLPMHGGGSRRRLTLRPAWWTGIAAMLLIGVVIGIYVASRDIAGEPAVVEELIDWNLAMADAEGPQEREQIYAQAAPKLEVAVGRAKLSEDDRRAARRLLDNGAWLRGQHPPAEQLERFCDLQDLVVARMDTAASADDAVAVGRLGPKLGRVQTGLDRLYATTAKVPAAELQLQRQLERIAKRQAEAQRRHEAAAANPNNKATRQALRRAMDAAKPPKRPVEVH